MSKRPVSTKTGFIFLFYCPTVSLETDKEKWQVLWPSFGKKVEIFGQFHETVILAKKLKLSDSAAKKLKQSAHGCTEAASFNFLQPNWQFQLLAKSRFHETAQKFNFFSKMDTKTAIFIVSFKWNWHKKKRNRFPY